MIRAEPDEDATLSAITGERSAQQRVGQHALAEDGRPQVKQPGLLGHPGGDEPVWPQPRGIVPSDLAGRHDGEIIEELLHRIDQLRVLLGLELVAQLERVGGEDLVHAQVVFPLITLAEIDAEPRAGADDGKREIEV